MASGSGAPVLAATTVHSPLPQLSSAPSTEGANSWVEAASAIPRTSSTRSFTLSITAGGTSVMSRSAAKAARRSASVMAAIIPDATAGLRVTRRSAGGRHAFRAGRDGAAPDGAHRTAVGVGGLELFAHAGLDHLLHEGLTLLPGRRGLMWSPPGD